MKILLGFILALRLAAENPEPHIKAAITAFQDGQAAARKKNGQQAGKSFLRAIDIEPTY